MTEKRVNFSVKEGGGMRKKRIFLWIVGIGIAVNLLLWANKERLVKTAAMKLVGVTDIIAATEKVDPDALTIKDFSDVPGVTQEYVDAYKIFLKANAQDKGEDTYEQAIAAFEKIVRTTKNPELKLRGLYLITLSNFLLSNIESAYKSGMQVLALSKKLRGKDKRIIFLTNLVAGIQKGKITSIGEIKENLQSENANCLKKAEEIYTLTNDLYLLPERSKEYAQMKKKYEEKKNKL